MVPEYPPVYPANEDSMTVKVHHISTTRPKAKKAYACSCCGRAIVKGEKHYKNIYKVGNNRTIRTERAHIKCPGW